MLHNESEKLPQIVGIAERLKEEDRRIKFLTELRDLIVAEEAEKEKAAQDAFAMEQILRAAASDKEMLVIPKLNRFTSKTDQIMSIIWNSLDCNEDLILTLQTAALDSAKN